jgi:hypothetical protein
MHSHARPLGRWLSAPTRAVVLEILGEIDGGHAALAEPALDAVAVA